MLCLVDGACRCIVTCAPVEGECDIVGRVRLEINTVCECLFVGDGVR